MTESPCARIDFPLLNNSIDECQRLFHGRGQAYEGWEHLNIDWLSPVALITLYKEERRERLIVIAEALIENIAACQSVQVQYRSCPKAPIELLLGEEVTETIVEELGLKYHIQLGQAQNSGLFLDMRNGREWVKQHSGNRRVLNLFAYTCPFSVSAIAGGASQVVNIDNNKGVLSRGRENHRLNEQDTKKVTFEGVNIFTSYSRIKKYAPYDLLICDPPSFQKGSVDIKRDYKKIISRIPQWMNVGSDLMLCLNSPDLTEQFIFDLVAEYCPDCQFIEMIKPPEVFKEAEQGRGLKVFIYRYLPSTYRCSDQ